MVAAHVGRAFGIWTRFSSERKRAIHFDAKKILLNFGIAKIYSCQNFGNLSKFWQDFLYSYQNLAAN
jgi:hypothetical protein